MERRFTLHNIKPKIYYSKTFDPAINLGFEEWILSNIGKDEIGFYLWQNEKTVVIGRNQNPWKECRLDLMKNDGVRLVRRVTGGGAVYHDLGNLNFTFVAHEENYDLEKQLNVIIQALKPFGINAEFTGRNDITVDGLKFSGNAFINEKGVSMQHGTLLVDVDMSSLGRYLSISPLKIKSKGIDSVKSRVVNLNTLSDEITIESFKQSLIDSFESIYGKSDGIQTFTNEGFEDSRKYYQWDWNFSEAPDFDVNFEEKFDWGIIDMNFMIQDGVIIDCAVYTDSITIEGFKEFAELLKGKGFTNQSISDQIQKSSLEIQVKSDIAKMIKERIV